MRHYGIRVIATGKALGVWAATWSGPQSEITLERGERSFTCSPVLVIGEHRGAETLFCTTQLDHAHCLLLSGVGLGSQPYALLQPPFRQDRDALEVFDLATGEAVPVGTPSPELAEYLANPRYRDVRD